MWQQSQSLCVVLPVIVSGSLLVPWDMTVFPAVTVPRGDDAVLSCSFTHPRQQRYSGTVTVRWTQGSSHAASPVFFSCSVNNDSAAELGECSASGRKHSLTGDPRQGELSLLVREAQLADNGTYVCRVQLDSRWEAFERKTHLYVAAKPQILSLSVVGTSCGPDSATCSLRCEVEGHPLPSVTWLSASSGLLGEQVQTSTLGPFRLVSSVPYLEEDVFTCRAESRLGGAERRFPASNALTIGLSVCGLVVLLLLLLLTGFICYRRNRPQETAVNENTDAARADTSSIYGNAEVVENHQLRGSSDSPAEGAVELVYSTLTLTSPHAAFKKSTQQQETEVLYSPVKVQR